MDGLQNIIGNVIAKATVPPEDTDVYVNEEDGLLYCSHCRKQKQVVIKWLGITHTVNCLCECESKSNAEIKMKNMEANREVKIKQLRSNCFGKNYQLWYKTFDEFEVHADNSKNFKMIKRYCDKFAEMKADNIGLRLCGSNGTGKTHLACAVANELVGREYSVLFRTMDELVAMVINSFDKNGVIDDICSYDLLIIDEFGQEALTSTVQQYVQDIINTRTVNKKPFIITTNVVNPDESQMTMADHRIYSRFNECLITIAFSGADMREKIHSAKVDKFKSILMEG